MKKGLLMMVLFVIGLLLVACRDNPNNHPSDFTREEISITQSILTGASLSETGTNYDTTDLTRIAVTQTFITNPTRVAIYTYDALDILDYVGIDQTSIQMLGIVKTNLPSFLNEYDDSAYEHVGTLFLPDYDVLDLFQPELIIIGSRTTGAYDALNEQYPNANILDVTMMFGDYAEDLTRNATNLGKIFPSIKDEIDSSLNDIIADFEDIAAIASLHESLFILVNGQSLSFYGPTGRFAILYDEFGFMPADDQIDTGGSHGDLVGYEYIAAVNPEVLFLLDRGAAIGNESTLTDVTNNRLVEETRAGENDHIYTLNGEAWYIASGGFTSTIQMILDIQTFANDITT